MRRFTDSEKNVIKQLTEEGYSINQIAKILGCGKTAAYYHSFKTRGPTCQKAQVGFENSEHEGEVIGIFTGDGNLNFVPGPYRYVVRITIGDSTYIPYVKDLFERAFHKNFRIGSTGHCKFVETYSKVVYDYFSQKLDFDPHEKSPGVHLRKITDDEQFKIGFLKGLLDTDGTICPDSKNSFKLAFYTTSLKLKDQVCALLSDLGIEWRIHKRKVIEGANYPLYTIRVIGEGKRNLIHLANPFKGKRLPETVKTYKKPVSIRVGP